MHSLKIVQWDSTRRDHPGYPGRVSGSGSVKFSLYSHRQSVTTKISMLQQIVQLATKIMERNMSRHFQSLLRHKVQIQ